MARSAVPPEAACPTGNKRAVNLTLSSELIDAARDLGLNVSATVDRLLAEEVKRQYWARWNDDNREAIDHYNARVASEGLPLARYRTFAKGR